MPVKPKLSFDNDGKVCPKDKSKAKLIPGCVADDDEEFIPMNRPPRPTPKRRKFKQFAFADNPKILSKVGSGITPGPTTYPNFQTAPLRNEGASTRIMSNLPQDDTNDSNVRVPRGKYDFQDTNTYMRLPGENIDYVLRSNRFVSGPSFDIEEGELMKPVVKRALISDEFTTPFKRSRLSGGGMRQKVSPAGPTETTPLFAEERQSRSVFRTMSDVTQEARYKGKQISRSVNRIRNLLEPPKSDGFNIADTTVFERTPATPLQSRLPRPESFSEPSLIRQQSAPPAFNRTLARFQNLPKIADQQFANISENLSQRFGQGYRRVMSDSNEIQSVEMNEEGIGRLPPPDPPPSPPIGVRKAVRLSRNPFEQQPSDLVSEIITQNGTELVDLQPRRTNIVPMEIETPTIQASASRFPSLRLRDIFTRVRGTEIRLPKTLDAGVGQTFRSAGAGAAAGILTNIGLTHLLPDTMPSHFATAATSGAVGDVAARMAAHIAERTTVNIGRSVASGIAEGGLVGVGGFLIDMSINSAMTNSGVSHGVSNSVSSGVAGGVTTAASAIMLSSLGAAPETLGLSVVVGGIATLGTVIFGAVSGANQDREEEEQRQRIVNISKYANARNAFLSTLSSHNYNFQEALNAYTKKADLGMEDETWNAFSTSAGRLFRTRPSNTPVIPQPPTPGTPPSADETKFNNLYSQYVRHNLITNVCSQGGAQCNDALRHDPGALSMTDISFLNTQSQNTWKSQADMQVTMSFQELNYSRDRIQNAQTAMVNAWKDGKTSDQLDPYIVETANLDTGFGGRYRTFIQEDAQRQIIDAFYTDQTRVEQMPASVKNAANLAPGFSRLIHAFYSDMDNASSRLQVTVPQLIELQGLDRPEAVRQYNVFQFDRQKETPSDVIDATRLSDAMLQIKQAGFYDLDQAMLETDPTHITAWRPTDSQILQAHAGGMNLNEYVEYMAELEKGDAGDYENLPQRSNEERKRIGYLDYSHFRDELQMGGYNPNLYSYNPKTRQFTRNTSVSQIPTVDSRNSYTSQYTPSNLRMMRYQYADMIHGLNRESQHQVDSFNSNLLNDLKAHGTEYQAMADRQNEYIYNTQRNPEHIMHFSIGEVYKSNKLTYHPLSDHIPPAGGNIANPISQGQRTPNDTASSSSPVVNRSLENDVSSQQQVSDTMPVE